MANVFVVPSYNSDTLYLWPHLFELCNRNVLDLKYAGFAPTRSFANWKDWSAGLDYYHHGTNQCCLNEDTMTIAHSMGCLCLIKYVAQNNIELDTCVFLAGFLDEVPNRIDINTVSKKFMPTEDEIEKFKTLVKYIYCIYDINDMTLNPLGVKNPGKSIMESFAEKMSAKKIVVSVGGHFGVGTGTQMIPELDELINAYSFRKNAEVRYDDIIKAKKTFGDWKDIIKVSKNGFDLYIPKNGNTGERDYFYVDSHKGYDCVAYDSVSTHTYLILKGEGEFTVNGMIIPAKEGSIITISPNCIFSYKGNMQMIEKICPKFNDEYFHVVESISYSENSQEKEDPQK